MFRKGQRETLNWLVLNVLRVREGTNPKPPVNSTQEDTLLSAILYKMLIVNAIGESLCSERDKGKLLTG